MLMTSPCAAEKEREAERNLEDWRRMMEERGVRVSRKKTEYMSLQ